MANNENVQIRLTDDDKGRGLFALRSFKEGDIIFEEKPLVCCQFSWNADYGYLACENCLKPLESAEENACRLTGQSNLVLPHPECCETKKELITECDACGIKYCSIECKSEAYDKYHKTLCLQSREKNEFHPLVQLNETWKQINYPPETSTIMLLAKMVALVNQSSDKCGTKNIFSQFCNQTANETQEFVHNLLGEKFVGQIGVLRETMRNALNTESVEEWFTPEGFNSFLALVGTNGQGIGTSAFARWAKNVSALKLPDDQRMSVDKLIVKIYDDMEEVVGSFLDNEGSGLYTLQSCLNHSCSPNAAVHFPHSDSTLVLKAIRDIQQGEEIYISYLSECDMERSRHSRQKILISHYLFKCRCNKCLIQADDLDLTSESDLDYDMSD